jgi:hypothetical protein
MGANKFTTYIPKKDMKLVPVFKSILRSYSLSLYDWDRTELLTNYSIPYGSDIGQYLKNNNYTCGYYNYRPYLQNQVDKTTFRFVFDGWQHEADIGKDTVNYSTLNEVLITRDLVLYAHYRKENYRTMHSDLKYFSEPTRDGYIGLATDYKTILRDEITLPKQYDNIIIKGIMADGFKNNTVITTIYFEDNNSYSTIDNRAFENCESL